MSDENKMGVKIIEFYFHKIDKIKGKGSDLSYFYVVIQIFRVLFLTILFLFIFQTFYFQNINFTCSKEEEDTGSAGEQPVSNTLYGYTV